MTAPRPHLPFPTIRDGLPLSAPLDWIRAGMKDLRACRGASLFYGVCFAVGGIIVVLTLSNAVQLVSGLITGTLLIGPLFAIGLYELSRQRERHEAPALRPSLVAWRGPLSAVAVYSFIVIIIYLIWARAGLIVFALFYDGGMPTLSSLLTMLLRFDNPSFLIAYFLVGGFFAGLVFSVSVVSIPLMLDRDQDAITSMIASFLALVRNPLVLLFWGFLISLLIGFGILLGYLGLIVTGPLVGHATWHAFRALIAPLEATEISQGASVGSVP